MTLTLALALQVRGMLYDKLRVQGAEVDGQGNLFHSNETNRTILLGVELVEHVPAGNQDDVSAIVTALIRYEDGMFRRLKFEGGWELSDDRIDVSAISNVLELYFIKAGPRPV